MKKSIFIIVLICLVSFIFSNDFSTVLFHATYAKITLVASNFDSNMTQSTNHLLFNGDSGHFQLNFENSERIIPWHNYWISWDGQKYHKPENGIIELYFPEVNGTKTLDIGISYWNNFCFVKSIQISKNRNEDQFTFLLDGNSQWSNKSEIVRILYPYVNSPAIISAQQYCYMPREVESNTEVDLYSPIDWKGFDPGVNNRSFTERTYQSVDFSFYPADEYNKNQEGKTRLYLQSEDSIGNIVSAYTDVMIDSVAPQIR
ncbi:MAG: hypothetical protein JXR70_00955, partial [Spirochaetales bacterium]|nr:hypothetical protein [Spirochaetales bacterium]